MAIHEDTEMTVVRFLLRNPRNRRQKLPCRDFATGEAPGLVERLKEEGGNLGKGLYCGFHGKELGRHSMKAEKI